MRRVIIATNNHHKVGEIRPLLQKDIELVTLKEIGYSDELAEDQDTLEGNSFQKADFIHQHFKADCFADDSGLEVDALNGAPGVFSARYAGPQRNDSDNIVRLLEEMKSIVNRRAQFRCVITMIDQSGTHVFEGILEGSILQEQRGGAGFGYDPVFLPNGESSALAEMTLEEKNRISHRGIAVRKLIDYLNSRS